MIPPGYPDATPLAGLGGGILIGLAAAVMLLLAGRIAGVSGIASRAIGLGGGMPGIQAWAFLLGLPAGAAIVALAQGGLDASFAGPIPLAIAGLVVGFGTRLGSGCTSGHGVCGMSRLSPRSIVATATFMTCGIATVAVMNALELEVLP
ncbi:YeeE/YedE family protein [Parerythrobacter aestuarii]|uniref:YeeE/YedE family protein n=1 Tax=Parerythrobacter aestuarii TaxID=3020909 RepID=UPI0024DEB904|nr:YeeE/YedE family protein [Parerythrobacter aestuarii]